MLYRVSGHLVELVSETLLLILLFKHICNGQRALRFQSDICVCMRIFLFAVPIEKVSFQGSHRRFCFYWISLKLGIQGQGLQLGGCSLFV